VGALMNRETRHGAREEGFPEASGVRRGRAQNQQGGEGRRDGLSQ